MAERTSAPPSAPGRTRNSDAEPTVIIDRRRLEGDGIFYQEVANTGDGTAEAVEEVTLVEDLPDRLHNAIAPRRDIGKPRLPRPGACVWLIIDKGILGEIQSADKETANRFLAEIKLVSDVADYDVSTQENTITIIGTAERAANSLLAIATSLKKVAPTIRILMGQGIIEHEGDTAFKTHGAPDEGTLSSWMIQRADIYLTDELAMNIIKPGSREGSHCEIQIRRSHDEELYALEGYKPRVERYTGGPDQLIGYEEQLLQLDGALRDDETRLIFLKGSAGIGKSRILSEVLATLPSYILCSLDAADKNIPGASLITLADQIAQIMKTEDDVWGEDLHAITEFSKKPRAEKIAYAQRHAKELADLCFNALQLTTFVTGQKSVFILEDLHNADRLSEPLLAGIAQRYALDTEGKALISMRPEEMYKSSAQDDLKDKVGRFHSEEAVQEVNLEGLDFADEQISRRFAYHCIPTEPTNRRGGKTVDQMGTWHKVLGRAAGRSPFVMTSLMQSVLETAGALDTEGETINVDRVLIDSFSTIRPDDETALATHFHQRIANLSQNARIALQAMALAGGRLTAGQIDKVVTEMVGGAMSKKLEVFAALREGGFIRTVEGEEGEEDYNRWVFQHEGLIPFVLSSITESGMRESMSHYLYGILTDDRQTHADTKLALLQNIVTGLETPDPDDRIWPLYRNAALEALADAEAHNNTGKAAAIATSILDKSLGSERVRAAITDLKEGEEVSGALAELAVAALMAAAKSALNLGRFDEVTEHTEELTKIHNRKPDLVDIDSVNLVRFEKAYLSRKSEDMERIFTNSIEKAPAIPETAKAIARIKIAFRKYEFDEASRLFAENQAEFEKANEDHKTSHEGMPSPDYMEILRLATVRIPFEEVRKKAQTADARTTVDDDCLIQPGALSGELRKKLEDEVLPALEQILAITKNFPTILNPHSELALLDQVAELEAFRGNWEETDKAGKEAWRIADQMQNHDAAARVARSRGDGMVVRALLASRDGTFATTDINLLKKAIGVYSREGAISIDQLGNSHIRALQIRINRIRAIGLLALRYQGETGKSKSALRMEMAPYFDQAFRDFEIINQEKEILDREAAKEAEYYLLGPFNNILQVANALGYQIPKDIADPEKYPYMTTSACISGLSFGANITDRGLNLGESTDKRKGLMRIFNGLIDIRDRRLAQTVAEG